MACPCGCVAILRGCVRRCSITSAMPSSSPSKVPSPCVPSWLTMALNGCWCASKFKIPASASKRINCPVCSRRSSRQTPRPPAGTAAPASGWRSPGGWRNSWAATRASRANRGRAALSGSRPALGTATGSCRSLLLVERAMPKPSCASTMVVHDCCWPKTIPSTAKLPWNCCTGRDSPSMWPSMVRKRSTRRAPSPTS
jgi:hypothetical protein